jgi:hypothetical protein
VYLTPILVYFYILIMVLVCALSCRSRMDVVATLGLLSNPPLLTLWLEVGR